MVGSIGLTKHQSPCAIILNWWSDLIRMPPSWYALHSMDTNTLAAISSAVAAAFSAAAALLSWRAQVRQVRESVRPELLLSGWIREKDSASGLDAIRFQVLSNVGRGTAKNVVLNAHAMADDGRATYEMSTRTVPSIPEGGHFEINGTILLWWNAVSNLGQGPKSLSLNVRIRFWDSVGVRHDTTVMLCVFEDANMPYGGTLVAPGVGFKHLDVRSESVWWLQLRRRFGKLD